MSRETVGIRPRQLTIREQMWVDNFRKHETPGSLRLVEDFLGSLRPGNRVLEVGCASGRVSIFLAEKKKVVVTGVDINPHEINYAQENSVHPKVNLEVMDGTQLEFPDNQFDSVVMVGVLGGVGEEVREELLSEAYRVVKPGGTVAVAEFKMNLSNPEKLKKYKEDAKETGEWGSKIIRKGIKTLFIAKHFTEDELVEMFKDVGFCSIQSREHNSIKAAGIGDGIEEVRRQYTVWGVKPEL